jgi:hypothetical protein
MCNPTNAVPLCELAWKKLSFLGALALIALPLAAQSLSEGSWNIPGGASPQLVMGAALFVAFESSGGYAVSDSSSVTKEGSALHPARPHRDLLAAAADVDPHQPHAQLKIYNATSHLTSTDADPARTEFKVHTASYWRRVRSAHQAGGVAICNCTVACVQERGTTAGRDPIGESILGTQTTINFNLVDNYPTTTTGYRRCDVLGERAGIRGVSIAQI